MTSNGDIGSLDASGKIIKMEVSLTNLFYWRDKLCFVFQNRTIHVSFIGGLQCHLRRKNTFVEIMGVKWKSSRSYRSATSVGKTNKNGKFSFHCNRT